MKHANHHLKHAVKLWLVALIGSTIPVLLTYGLIALGLDTQIGILVASSSGLSSMYLAQQVLGVRGFTLAAPEPPFTQPAAIKAPEPKED